MTKQAIIDNANQLLCISAIAEYHEIEGGGENLYHPAIRFDLVRGGVVDPHHCQDIKNAPTFETERAAIQYAITYLSENPYFAIDATMEING